MTSIALASIVSASSSMCGRSLLAAECQRACGDLVDGVGARRVHGAVGEIEVADEMRLGQRAGGGLEVGFERARADHARALRLGGRLAILDLFVELHRAQALRIAGGGERRRADGARPQILGGRQRDLDRIACRERAHAAIGLEGDVHELPAQLLPARATLGGELNLGAAGERGVLQRAAVLAVLEVHVCGRHRLQRAHGAAAGDARVAAQLDEVGLIAIRIQLHGALVRHRSADRRDPCAWSARSACSDPAAHR